MNWPQPEGKTVSITCEECGCRSRLQRRFREPETVILTCPACESIIWAQVTQHVLDTPARR